jgi:hypothetical protein
LFRKIIDLLDLMDPRPLLKEENKLSLVTGENSRIISLPASEQTVRGFSSVDLLIYDEAARIPDDMFFSLAPMLAVSQGSTILLSTPWGKTGFFYEVWIDDTNDWKKVSIPASECPRISKETLASEKKLIGEYFFSQEYECQFLSATSSFFDIDRLRGLIEDGDGWQI